MSLILLASLPGAFASHIAEIDCSAPNVIKGTPGDDPALMGTPGDDVICGLEGDDTIDGGGGNDTIDGGDGNDFIRGREGDDVMLDGSHGDDIIDGGPGADRIRGREGDDLLDGGLGDDIIDGGPGADTATYATRASRVVVDGRPEVGGGGEVALNESDQVFVTVENLQGTSFDDVLIGNQYSNTLRGGPGADTLCGSLGVDSVDYSDQTGPVSVSIGSATTPLADPRRRLCIPSDERRLGRNNDCVADDGLAGEGDCVGEDIEHVTGGSGDDTLVGNDPVTFTASPLVRQTGENLLRGGPGNDTLAGRAGPDVLEGGAGNDTVTYADRTAAVIATIDGNAEDGDATDFDPVSQRHDSIGTDIENAVGGSGDDTLRGDDAGNVLSGGLGNDFLNGGGGEDALNGGGGNDSLDGAGGDDSLFGDAGNDAIAGAAGSDALDGGPGDDILRGGSGADSLAGGDGSDVADYSAALTPVTVSANAVPDDGTAGEGDNVITDVEGANGGIDNDVLIGNAGGGILSGGGGDDVLDGGGGADTLHGDDGVDTASYAGRGASVAVDLAVPGGDGEAGENDDVTASVEKVAGGAGADTLSGDSDANVLSGGPGNDTLDGRGGPDLLSGGSGTDILTGGDGRDILGGDDGNDTLKGGSASDSLSGGAGADSLDGGPGADTVSGGPGDDTADYAGRRGAVQLTLNGSTENGEAREGDFVRTDVESARTGAGNDLIDARDSVRGTISCGPGADRVTADPLDKVEADCEQADVAASARCSISRRAVRMTRRGVVPIRIVCPVNARGTLTLRTARSLRKAQALGQDARKLRLGRKSFSARSGKPKIVRVKLARKARRLVRRQGRLRVEAIAVNRSRGATGKAARRRAVRKITVKAPSRKGPASRRSKQ